MPTPAPNAPRDKDEEEPLDPRLEAVAVKMRRLSLVSSGLMFLGIFAVLGVILYRSLSAPSSTEYPANITAEEVRSILVERVVDAQINHITADERSLFVGVDGQGGPMILEIDRATWQIVSTVEFAN